VIEKAYRKTGKEVGFAVRVGYEEVVRRILLGRDVINEFELTVCAKRGVVRFDWVPNGST